jgi:hypothetical protein
VANHSALMASKDKGETPSKALGSWQCAAKSTGSISRLRGCPVLALTCPPAQCGALCPSRRSGWRGKRSVFQVSDTSQVYPLQHHHLWNDLNTRVSHQLARARFEPDETTAQTDTRRQSIAACSIQRSLSRD